MNPPSSVAIRDAFRDFLLRMAAGYSRFPDLRPQEESLRELAASADVPFTLAVFGYMKTGKSTLINALVGRPLAITGTDETTATLNWISYGDRSQKDTMVVHWKNGREEPMPLERLADWAGKSEPVLDRVRNTRFLQLYAEVESLRNIQIVDTPGIGSVVGEHTDSAASVLSAEEGRKADALLYVFPAVAKELDENTLLEFSRTTRLPGSDPYNSIGVLHKWDGLETDGEDPIKAAESKARTLAGRLSDVLCDVIPVSAPLGLVARHAPDRFLEALLEIVNAPGAVETLAKALRKDDRWKQDDARNAALGIYPDLPWTSFRRTVNLLLEHRCESVAAARAVCLEASGIPRLEEELDRRFFRNAAVIKQRLTRVKAMDPIRKGTLSFIRRLEGMKGDAGHFRELAALFPQDATHAVWLREKQRRTEEECSALEEVAVELDRAQLDEEERMNLLENDLGFLEKMDREPGFVDGADTGPIRLLLGQESACGPDPEIPAADLERLLSRYQHEAHGPGRSRRELFEHLVYRISERLSLTEPTDG